ncbi:MAG: plastocyanin/azurin family copper-binding protein [Agriterribacter sp.]
MFSITLRFAACIVCIFTSSIIFSQTKPQPKPAVKIDRNFVLEATMLGYIAKDGTKNPVLKVTKGERVLIKIINGEVMTHDICLEKMNIKSKALSQKGTVAFITFTANYSDVYYCSTPGHRAAGMVGKLVVVNGPIVKQTVATGTLPMKDGKPLNLNFETGTLKDWMPKGDAFTSPLINTDPSPVHEKDMNIGREGKYFVTSGGTKMYQRTGSLTSVPFVVTQPYASFRVSGGALRDTRVELVDAATDTVFYEVTGQGRATLQPVVVDLAAMKGKSIYIRLIDNETGISTIPYIPNDIWAHISFDDFRFHATRPVFPNELKKEDIVALPPLDVTKYAGLSGVKAAEVMTVPDGFKVTLAASEPEIIKPICFTIDYRGRLWVAEAHTYPVRAAEGQGKDRILIFEDTDGDGTLDSKKVFTDGLNLVSGIEVGMGGVWVGASPYLLFIPMDEQTDKPSGPPQILLDGWDYHDTHETLNAFQWGPDGWLYGTHGVFNDSKVGRPGTPDNERILVKGSVWRIHPVTKKFEVFARGTSNPWGIDFNDYGAPFITACVVEHLYHITQGARYTPQAGMGTLPPYTYEPIKTIADHVHWLGNRGPHAGNGRSGAAGGGHAHAGAMVYLGGDSWPAMYRNNIFMNNIHGSRVNMDILSRSGSGYTGAHGKDFLLANDSWSQWINFRYDASGSIFAIDWYDKNQCHSPNPDVHDKTLGRIFKVSNVNDKWVKVDLSKETDLQLVNHQLDKNDWYVRQSRLLLQKRGPNPEVHAALKKILFENPDVTRKLRALWALHVIKGITEDELIALLSNESEYIRGWAIQLLAENAVSEKTAAAYTRLASSDPSPLVRVYLTSAVQRMEASKRWSMLRLLYNHSEDKDDQNIPLLLWYTLEPLVKDDPKQALDLAFGTSLPHTLNFTIQRIADINTPESKKILEETLPKLNADPQNHSYHEAAEIIQKALSKK